MYRNPGGWCLTAIIFVVFTIRTGAHEPEQAGAPVLPGFGRRLAVMISAALSAPLLSDFTYGALAVLDFPTFSRRRIYQTELLNQQCILGYGPSEGEQALRGYLNSS